MDMTLLKSELVRDEGLRLSAYKDTVGCLTIGVGRNLDGNPLSRDELSLVGHNCRTKPITEEQAMCLLENDVARVMLQLDKALSWWVTLDEVRRRVLINMAFNMGIKKLLGFKRFLMTLNNASYAEAATEMLDSKWAEQVGKRADRLSIMMRTGKTVQ